MKSRAIFFAACLAASFHAPAEDKPAYEQDFSTLAPGDPPDGEMMAIEGAFQVVEKDGGKWLALPAEPLVDGGMIFGPSTKGAATVQARITASKTRRSFPRFGVGLHGVSGYRLLVTPAKKTVELVKEEQVVASAPFEWKAEAACLVRLRLEQVDGKWRAQAWAWAEGEKQPEEPTLSQDLVEAPGQGKASVWGAPYAGKEVRFDDLKVFVAPGK